MLNFGWRDKTDSRTTRAGEQKLSLSIEHEVLYSSGVITAYYIGGVGPVDEVSASSFHYLAQR